MFIRAKSPLTTLTLALLLVALAISPGWANYAASGDFVASGDESPYELTFQYTTGTSFESLNADFDYIVGELGDPLSFKSVTASGINSVGAWAIIARIMNDDMPDPWVDSSDVKLNITATNVPAEIVSGDDPFSWAEAWTKFADISHKPNATINVTLDGPNVGSADALLKLLSSPDSLVSFDRISVEYGATLKLPATVDVGSLNVYAASVDLTAFTTKSALTSKLGGKVTFSSWYLAPDPTVVFYPSLDVSGIAGVATLLASLDTDPDLMDEVKITVQGISGVTTIPAKVTSFDVPDVQKPISDDHPVFAVSALPQYTGDVTWMSPTSPDINASDDKDFFFSYGVGYSADIILTAGPGYTFDDIPANSFRVDGVSADSPLGTITEIRLLVSFDAAGSHDLRIPISGDIIVTPPATGVAPSTSASVLSFSGSVAEAKGTIEWPTDAYPTFKGNTSYKGKVTLNPLSGYTFTNFKADDFKFPSATSFDAPKLSGDQLIIENAAFPTTPKTVTANSISGIQAPAWGKPATWTLADNTQYSGSVGWNDLHSPDAFKPATVYTATITLSADADYTFGGVSQDWFEVTGAVNTNNSANSGVVTATFPITGNGMSAASASIITDAISEDLAKVLGGTPHLLDSLGTEGNTSVEKYYEYPIGQDNNTAPYFELAVPGGANPEGGVYVVPVTFSFTLTSHDLQVLSLDAGRHDWKELYASGLRFSKLQREGRKQLQDFTFTVGALGGSGSTYTLNYIVANAAGSPVPVVDGTNSLPLLFDGEANDTLTDPILMYKTTGGGGGGDDDGGWGCAVGGLPFLLLGLLGIARFYRKN